MPAFSALPADDVWRLVTYIKSLSGQAGSIGVARGDRRAGEGVFFGAAGGCASCHEVNGRGSDLASDLSAEGTKPVAAIRAGVLHQTPLRNPPHFADVTTKDGRVTHGLVRNEDGFYLQIETAAGEWMTLDKKDVRAVRQAEDVQPHDMATRLSAADVDNVAAYLAGLKARDLSQTAKASPAPVLSYARLSKKAEPQNWASYWGDYHSHHFSELAQINASNVGLLQGRWSAPLPGGNIESQPLVVDGVMYVTGAPGSVYAFDAQTGFPKWSFTRAQDKKSPYQINPDNRGVAVLDGRVFFGTLDTKLIALDAHTGRELWETVVGDTLAGVTITGAPLALDGKIITGVSGGEFGARGYLDAYDPATGKRLWRTYTVPVPGEPGIETWAGDSWKLGGAPTWLTGSYDPELKTLYWATGNPGPDYNPDPRQGDNLFSDCILALDPENGKIKWYYQFTPNDPHDWDSTEAMVLAEQVIDGKPRKLILHADRNGFFYVLDRTNGALILAKPFVKQTWNLGFDKNGRPIVDPNSAPTPEGRIVFPATGGTNFQAPSYDDRSKLFFLEYVSAQGTARNAPQVFEPGKEYLGRGGGAPLPAPPPEQGVQAIDSATGKTVWKFPLSRVSLSTGVLGTRGGLLFVASAEGQILALQASTGKPLWHFRTNGAVSSSPMSYAVDGKQYVAFTAANAVHVFALPDGISGSGGSKPAPGRTPTRR
jgi:alcohol dehydrogenase (cytochrome c)